MKRNVKKQKQKTKSLLALCSLIAMGMASL